MKSADITRLRRNLRYVLLGAGGLLAFLVIVGTVAVIPNQVREVAEPRPAAELSGLAAQLGGGSGSAETATLPLGLAVLDGPSSSPAGALPDDVAALLAQLRPVADPASLPANLQQLAQEWNAAIDGLTTRLLDILNRLDTLTYDQAVAELLAISSAYRQFEKSYYREEGKLSGTTRIANMLHPADRKAADLWTRTRLQVRLAVNAKHEQWEKAAKDCIHLASPDWPGRGEWWDAEVYYRRQMGLRGRAFIAVRTIQPVAEPIFDAVLHKPGDLLEAAWDGLME